MGRMGFNFFPKKEENNQLKWIITSAQSHIHLNNPDVRGCDVFENAQAALINLARLNHLEMLQMPISGKRVLDVGCGVGHLAHFFKNKKCEVVCVDARKNNIEILKNKHPELEAYHLNIETDSIEHLGQFDIIFCYGLLYHLENPILALRRMNQACKDFLLLETIVTDCPHPIMQLVDESLSSNQALNGMGHRPSPSYVIFVLNRIGFSHVYMSETQPNHKDFIFDWKEDMSCVRDGHNLRCVFVASKHQIDNEKLKKVF